jgi:hypothetical protein
MKNPTPNSYSLFNQDILYNMSNRWGVIEFQHDEDRRVHGGTVIYHLGQSIYHAAVNFFTKTSPISIMNSLASVFGLWIIWLR